MKTLLLLLSLALLALSWVGNPNPSQKSLTTSSPLVINSLEHYRAGVTDNNPPPGQNTRCFVHRSSVNVDWNNVVRNELTFSNDVGNNDRFTGQIPLDPGNYEFTFVCTTTAGGNEDWYDTQGVNFAVQVTLPSCPENEYRDGSNCIECHQGSTSPSGSDDKDDCECDAGLDYDANQDICRQFITSVDNPIVSPPTLNYPNDITITIDVLKPGVTDTPGKHASINCTISIDGAASFSEEMAFSTQNGNKYVYSHLLQSPLPGKYQGVVSCTDDNEVNKLPSAPFQFEQMPISCNPNQYSTSGTACTSCPFDSTSPGGVGLDIESCSCNNPDFDLDIDRKECRDMIDDVLGEASDNLVTFPDSISLAVVVFKEGVTEAEGKANSISCFIEWAMVSNFNDLWSPTDEAPLTYIGEDGDYDAYISEDFEEVGKYKALVYCIDEFPSKVYYDSELNFEIDILSCPENNYAFNGTACALCPQNSTSPSSSRNIEYCKCDSPLQLDTFLEECRLFIQDLDLDLPSSTAYYPNAFEIGLWVEKEGSTDTPGNYEEIDCFFEYISVEDFGNPWVGESTEIEMSSTDMIEMGFARFEVSFSNSPGKYEAQAYCTDDNGYHKIYFNSTLELEILPVMCEAGKYSISETECESCFTGSTTEPGKSGKQSCTCLPELEYDGEQGICRRFIGWVGERSVDDTTPNYPDAAVISLQVFKKDVTEASGQGEDIQCYLQWSPVSNFGGNWQNQQLSEMEYVEDIDNNDHYSISFEQDPGFYEAVVYCTDNNGVNKKYSEGSNLQIAVGEVVCEANEYSTGPKECATCPENSISLQGSQSIANCNCTIGKIDEAKEMCRYFVEVISVEASTLTPVFPGSTAIRAKIFKMGSTDMDEEDEEITCFLNYKPANSTNDTLVQEISMNFEERDGDHHIYEVDFEQPIGEYLVAVYCTDDEGNNKQYADTFSIEFLETAPTNAPTNAPTTVPTTAPTEAPPVTPTSSSQLKVVVVVFRIVGLSFDYYDLNKESFIASFIQYISEALGIPENQISVVTVVRGSVVVEFEIKTSDPEATLTQVDNYINSNPSLDSLTSKLPPEALTDPNQPPSIDPENSSAERKPSTNVGAIVGGVVGGVVGAILLGVLLFFIYKKQSQKNNEYELN